MIDAAVLRLLGPAGLTREQLAEQAGLSRRDASAALKRLHREGLVEVAHLQTLPPQERYRATSAALHA